MIDIDAERVRFEAWILADTNVPSTIRKNADGSYLWHRVQGMLDSWLAAKRDASTNEESTK